MSRAEKPDSVNATIARAPRACAARAAASEIASGKPTSTRSWRRRRAASQRTARSARRARGTAARGVRSAHSVLALGGDRHVRGGLAPVGARLRAVRRRPHERAGVEGHTVLEAEAEVVAILLGEARDGQRNARERDPL